MSVTFGAPCGIGHSLTSLPSVVAGNTQIAAPFAVQHALRWRLTLLSTRHQAFESESACGDSRWRAHAWTRRYGQRSAGQLAWSYEFESLVLVHPAWHGAWFWKKSCRFCGSTGTLCCSFANPASTSTRRLQRRARRYRELASSHHLPVTMPEKVADLLVRACVLIPSPFQEAPLESSMSIEGHAWQGGCSLGLKVPKLCSPVPAPNRAGGPRSRNFPFGRDLSP